MRKFLGWIWSNNTNKLMGLGKMKSQSQNFRLNALAWHTVSSDSAMAHFKTPLTQGLTREEATNRLMQLGKNILEETHRRSLLKIFLDQFTDFMILVLIGAAIIAGFLGGAEDTIAIAVIVFLNAILGFIQEYRAERAIEALKVLAVTQARVLRAGKIDSIPSQELVPGDIVFLEAGNLVPADMRLIESTQLKIEEAALTGESLPVEKNIDIVPKAEAPIADRFNMAYKGTLVSYGRGAGIVVATGMRTELGRIATLLRSEKTTKTPLQKRLARFGQGIALSVIALCAVIFVVGLLYGEKPLLMFMTALSLAVAAVPEALPAVVTVLLAMGARRMVKQNALIRHLPAVETLGSVTYICSDKTGTLTRNQMRVDAYAFGREIVPAHLLNLQPEEMAQQILFQAMALNNDISLGAQEGILGDPTEIALYNAAKDAGVVGSDIKKYFPRVGEIPFSSERGKMTTLHGEQQPLNGKIFIFTKGAPERIISRCKQEWIGDELVPFDQEATIQMMGLMARKGLRVLAYAYKKIETLPNEINSETIEKDLVFIGLVGLIDPPRPGVKQAVELCQTASIRVVMITGDHPATALAIAIKLGIVNETHPIQGLHGPVLTGQELAKMSLEEFETRVKDIRVYARVSPEQKIKIVKALQDKGEFVAMTGDGVNDAPALKRANIGVAMGKIGTDVAREAAHMVLLDDNFATIVNSVGEGRRIFDNIRKFIKFALTGNSAEIWTIFLAPFLGLPIPFLPIHILWINLVTDGLPGLAIAAEPQEIGIMKRPPRLPSESIFSHGLWQHAVWVGLLMAAINLSVMAWAYRSGLAHWQSMVFTVLTLSQMGHVLAIRSERESLFRQGLFSNIPILGAVLFTFVLQMALLYVPIFNSIFKTEPLSLAELFLCLGVSSLIFFVVEGEKWLVRRKLIYQSSGLSTNS